MPSQFFCFCANVEQNNKPTRLPKALFWPVIRISLPLCFFFFAHIMEEGLVIHEISELKANSVEALCTVLPWMNISGPSCSSTPGEQLILEGHLSNSTAPGHQHSERPAPSSRGLKTGLPLGLTVVTIIICPEQHVLQSHSYTVLGPQGFREG